MGKCLLLAWFSLFCGQLLGQEMNKQAMINQMLKYEEVLSQQTRKINVSIAEKLMAHCYLFEQHFSEDTLAPIYLFRAADIARGLEKYHQAIATWEKIEQKYPNHRKVPEAHFMIAYSYENDIKDYTEAENHYQLFLEKYPKHELKKDVELLLGYLRSNQNPEILIKDFQKRHGEN